MSLSFSSDAGAWERHLQRKYRNPLFPEKTEDVVQEALEQARAQDRDERQYFLEEFQELLERITGLQEHVDNDVMLDLKEQIDKLYLQAKSLGGEHEVHRQGLVKLHDVVMESLRRTAGSDRLAQSELEQEAQAHAMHLELLENVLVADLLRPDSPIAEDELLPSLLSESEDQLRAALALFDRTQLELLCQRGREMLLRLQQDEQVLEPYWARLNVMEGLCRLMGSGGPLQ